MNNQGIERCDTRKPVHWNSNSTGGGNGGGGGGAQSDVWCQIFAGVMNLEIKLVADPFFANARGAAWIAAVGLGEIKFDDISELVKFKRAYQPQLQNRAIYDEKFEIFQQTYKQMKGIYRRLNG